MRPVYGAIDFHSFGQRVFFPNGKQRLTDLVIICLIAMYVAAYMGTQCIIVLH